MEESDDVLWDQRSDFFKLGRTTGYRNGILGEFEKAEKEGRLSGFHKASQTCINPTIFLSRLNGLLTACLLKLNETLSEEQKEEAYTIQVDIKKMLTSIFKPTPEIIQESSNIKSTKCSSCKCNADKGGMVATCGCDDKHCKCVSVKEFVPQYESILARTKAFCLDSGWKIPDCIVER